MDFVNVLRGLKKSRSEAKLGLSDRLSVGRKSSKTRIKSGGGGGGAPIGDIPEDSTAPSLHSPPPPARHPYSQTGDRCNIMPEKCGINSVRSIACFLPPLRFPTLYWTQIFQFAPLLFLRLFMRYYKSG